MDDLKKIHKECHKIFIEGFFSNPDEVLQKGNDPIVFFPASNACRVYDKLAEDDSRTDCIGENFNQLIYRIAEEWFGNYSPSQNLDYYFNTYFLQLYLFVERVDLIFDVLNKDGKSKLFNDFHFNNFKTLRKINKWANFIKHPKEFLFTHWPQYYIEGNDVELSDGDVKINTDFIFDHYLSEKKPSPVILQNNDKVFVEVPNLKTITSEFCKEMNIFFDFICSNQIVADYLKKKSTIENYYDIDIIAEEGIFINHN